MNPKIVLEQFDKKYSIDELRKKALKEEKNTILEQKKVYYKKRIKALSNIAIINNKKKNTWYFNTIAIIYMTYNFSFYISFNLDHQIAKIKIVDNIIFKTQDTNLINLYISVKIQYNQIELKNVYYLSKLNINLILFEVFKVKKCDFCTVNCLL